MPGREDVLKACIDSKYTDAAGMLLELYESHSVTSLGPEVLMRLGYEMAKYNQLYTRLENIMNTIEADQRKNVLFLVPRLYRKYVSSKANEDYLVQLKQMKHDFKVTSLGGIAKYLEKQITD